MGRLKGGANTEEEADKLSLAEINKLIAHAEWRFKNIEKSSLRNDAFRRLTWLEKQRERVHGVAAPDREHRRRG
jgi:hypothetical protein